jgi:glycopeptide antibiotics resistance protein
MTVSVTTANPSQADKRLAIVAIGVVAMIVYGSLYPFHFMYTPVPGGPLLGLLESWRISTDWADNLSNFLLYLPLGIVLAHVFRTSSRWTVALLTIATGFGLSMCMEMIQFYDPGRISEMPDVYMNTAGTAAGVLVAQCLRQVTQPYPVLLLACWMGNRLFPYFPRLDFHVHLASVSFEPLEFYKQTVYWLAAGAVFESILDASRSRIALGLTIALVLIARLFLIASALSIAGVAGALTALVLWIAILGLQRRVAIVTILFVVLVILQALEPFHFLTAPREFDWAPFASFITSPRDTAVRVFFEKAFTYGALVWLPVRAGLSLRVTTIGAVALVFFLRLAQVYLPDRSAEVTDSVMVLMFAGLMFLLRQTARQPSAPAAYRP